MRRSNQDVSEFSSATKWRIPVVQQRTDAARAVPESSEEGRASTGTACTGRVAIQQLAHDAGKDRRARYSQSGCCQDCQRKQPQLGASSMRFERSSRPPRPSRQRRCRRKPSTSNGRRSCRSEGDQQSKINLVRRRSTRLGLC